jgi:predicted pyridoxine 5'-phosphate oxidase superfamily flavin-nucleotide-binding protein
VNAAPETPFHAGELEMQERAGMRERLASGAMRFIRDHLTDQHREFFAQLPFVAAGLLDAQGRPWAGMLAGAPGFISTPDDRHLAIRSLPAPGNPLARALRAGANLGLLGIEFHTRRRNRANGIVEATTADGMLVGIQQSYGNCPQYIAHRTLVFTAAAADCSGAESAALSPRAVELIRSSKTLFIASAARTDPHDRREGCDVSHRGGEPGFVAAEERGGQTQLWIPDYRGNNFFNTFGNILRYPRAGLAFADFERGCVLMLTGDARVVWEEGRRGLSFAPARGSWQALGVGLKADTNPH